MDYMRLEGYDKEGFAQHGPGDDARSSVIRAALAPTGRDLLPQVMWLPAAAVRFPLGQQFPEQLPTGKTLEQIPHMMMTVHPLCVPGSVGLGKEHRPSLHANLSLLCARSQPRLCQSCAAFEEFFRPPTLVC